MRDRPPLRRAGYRPKPERRAFEAILAADGSTAAQAATFEDDPRNLEEPAALGMRTVLVGPDAPDLPHVHHHTTDLAALIAALTAPGAFR